MIKLLRQNNSQSIVDGQSNEASIHIAHNLHKLPSRVYLGCVFLRKSRIGFLNPKESEKGFCVSLPNRLIQDLSDHGALKEPKNPLWKWILRFF